MPVISARTRNQLERSIGNNLGAVYVGETTDSAADATSVIDSKLWGATDERKGQWVHITDTDTTGPVGEVRRVTANDTTVDLTTTTFSKNVVTGMEYLLWDEDFRPEDVQNLINDAVRSITRKGAPADEDLSLHTGGKISSFTVPSAVVGIQKIRFRFSETGTQLLNCDAVFDESVDTDVTASADGEDYREGSGSNKFTLAAGLDTAAAFVTDSITAKDISGHTHCEFWIKSTEALTAGDVCLLLDNDSACASPTETLSVPVTDSGTWTWHRVALANPQSDTGIISVGLQQKTDLGAATVWVDDISTMREGSGRWEDINKFHWRMDRANQKILFDQTAMAQMRYAPIQLLGYKKPTELTTDTTLCDIEPSYIIARATAGALRSSGNRYADRRDAAWLEAERWEALAERALTRQQTPSDVRWCL